MLTTIESAFIFIYFSLPLYIVKIYIFKIDIHIKEY